MSGRGMHGGIPATSHSTEAARMSLVQHPMRCPMRRSQPWPPHVPQDARQQTCSPIDPGGQMLECCMNSCVAVAFIDSSRLPA